MHKVTTEKQRVRICVPKDFAHEILTMLANSVIVILLI
jgi:dTDP-4-dehydrorhamnose 3,5-epimerase-like enzyme